MDQSLFDHIQIVLATISELLIGTSGASNQPEDIVIIKFQDVIEVSSGCSPVLVVVGTATSLLRALIAIVGRRNSAF